MSKNELSELIHRSVCETLANNKEEFNKSFLSLFSSISLQPSEQSPDLENALFDYTTLLSELTCVSVFKALSSIGSLNISLEDD